MIMINKATTDDLSFLATVCRSVASLYDPIMPGAFEKQAKKYETQGLPAYYNIFVVETDNKPFGFIGLKDIDEEVTYMVALYFLMDQQRQGLGRKTINQLVDTLSKRGIKEIVLLVHKDAYWAVNFYKNNGFETVTEDLEEIKKYADSRMEAFALPSTILMKKML